MHLSAYLIFCLFATFLAGVRYLITDTTDLVGLVWNLLLGFIPYLFALWYESDKRKISRFVAFFFWIFFLPNSFYILTDFIHLHKYPEMAFYDIVYISAMAFAGMIAGFASIEIFHREYNIHYHKKIAWIFI